MQYVSFIDEDKNLYEISINGNAYLTLHKEKKPRSVGKVDYYNKAFIKTRKNTHLFYKTQEFGFPYYLLKFLIDRKLIEKIYIDWDNYVFALKVDENLLKNSNFRYFKKQGFEKQVFIPVSRFKKIQKEFVPSF